MRVTSALVLLLLAVAITTTIAKSGKKKKKGKGNKKPPQWKPNSMPLNGKKFLYFDEGEDTTLDCRSKGKPKPKVDWYYNGRELSEDDLTQMKRSGELILTGLTHDRRGNYTCMVANALGSLEWNFEVEVQAKVSIMLEGPRNITSLSGSNAQFTCRVLNDPTATIRWFKGRAEDRNFLSHTGDIKEILLLEDIQKSDEGYYGCQASNMWNKKSKEAYLQVIEPRPAPKTTSEAPVTVVDWVNGGFDPYFTTKKHRKGQGGAFDNDMYFTTKKPKNRNGGRKNKKDKKNKNKNKKNKHKNNGLPKYDFGDLDLDKMPSLDPITTTSTTPSTTTPGSLYPTDDKIWEFNNNKGKNKDNAQPDDRFREHVEKTKAEEEKQNGENGDDEVSGSISSWTIYTVVGAVGGVVLLIGLIAITLTLCLRREDGGVYKSTPV